MNIKDEHLDSYIRNPLTGKVEWVRMISPDLYIHLYNAGLTHLFEIEKIVEKKVEVIVSNIHTEFEEKVKEIENDILIISKIDGEDGII